MEFGDLDGLEKALRSWLDREDLDRDALAAQAAKVYGADAMIRNFERVYEECNEAK